MPDRPRLAVLATHPIQYQAPLFRRLALDGLIDVHVLFLSRHGVEIRSDPGFGTRFKWDVDLLSGYAHSFVPNLRSHATTGSLLGYVNPHAIPRLSSLRPDVVLLLGARSPTALAVLTWARRHHVPCLYRAESSVLAARSSRSRCLARAVLSQVDGVVAIGTANDLYYQSLGIPPARRYSAPYTVDNAFFRETAIGKADARSRLGLDGDEVIVLYAGKLLPWKGVHTLIDACASLSHPTRVLVAGDGPERDRIENLATARNVPITILGFLNQTQISLAYGAADVLALPSLDEPWGLVVNEAMTVGVPVIASSQVSARLDLVVHGVTGAVFRAGDVSALAAALDPLVSSSELRQELGRAAERRMASWDIPQTADGIVRAVSALG